MRNRLKTPKYTQSIKDIRKQLPTLSVIAAMFIFNILYASGLRNDIMRMVIAYSSLCFPLIIIWSLLLAVPNVKYSQIDSSGVHITILGFIRRYIYWANIESVDKIVLGGIDSLGIVYKSPFRRFALARIIRKKSLGWDDFLTDAHQSNGAPLIEDVVKTFGKYKSLEAQAVRHKADGKK